MEALLCFLTYHYFIQTILQTQGHIFGIDLETATGITTLANITTFDMSILSSIIIALLTVYFHDKYFEKTLPEALGTFNGSVFVYVVMFFVLIPVAYITVLVWPTVQGLITSTQGLILGSGAVGVGIYTFLERILIPTGLHHLVYQPFEYGDLVVQGGANAGWIATIETARTNGLSLIETFPAGGYMLFGLSKVFGSLGIAAAFYATSKPEKRKKTLGLLIPITLTAMLVGVTEPLEFTFIFIAPVLFLIHAILAGLLAGISYAFGVSGNFANGLINFATLNWIPLGSTHGGTYITQIIIGLSFSVIYFFIFRFAIKKWNFLTPGREAGEEIKFYSKKEFKDREAAKKDCTATGEFEENIINLVECLGGEANITSISNCMTRLRIDLGDENLLASEAHFKACGAHGIMKSKNNVQVIIGLKVPKVRDELERYIESLRATK